ncbi:MAG TPA: heme A synthase [Chloroflexi bacterium]|nr:heme A synthase [Chloroflexota bacterium]
MVNTRFSRFARGVLGYNLAVILWGAYVRATGSGAGCGAHWPLCNGEIIPRAPQVETVVEFTHRVTSGLVLVLAVALVVWAWRAYPPRHTVRFGAATALVFTLTEALVGAGLVLFEMVADNTSIERAFWMMGHLANTFILLAALTLTALWSSQEEPRGLIWNSRLGTPLVLGVVAMIVLGASGAVTALGDTLFPVSSLAEGIRQDFSPTAHFLVRLRIFHPIIAVIVGAYLAGMGWWMRAQLPERAVERLSLALAGLFAAQLVLGVINVLLLAPVWMQLVHLLFADLVWICLVLLGGYVLGQPQPAASPVDHPVHHRVKQASQ